MKQFENECLIAYNSFNPVIDLKERVPDIIWDFKIDLPEPPPAKTIANWGLPKDKRRFPFYTSEFKREMEYNSDQPERSDEYQSFLDFISEEWRRRREGYWFYNGDNLEYITGHHYMFLQYWIIPVTQPNGRKRAGNAKFKDIQRDVYYCLDQARKDLKSAGVVWTSLRRIGKTALVASDMYWDTTGNHDSMSAIQSKTDTDAEGIFKKIVYSWQKLPSYWKPLDDGSTSPTKAMSFVEPKRRSTKGDKKVYRDVLNSVIWYESSGEVALDGQYLSYIFHDEAGKLKKPIDANERWNVVRECISDGARFVGFGVVATTVEDWQKFYSEKYIRLWERSNPAKRLSDGKTDSGLYRLFTPCYYGFEGDDEDAEVSFVDEWGYTNIEASIAYFNQMYLDKPGDLSFRRKYPMTISDAFSIVTERNNFDQEKIHQQKTYNEQVMIDQVVRGNFEWRDGIKDTEVIFYPDKNGRWLVGWMPPEDDRNRWEIKNGHKYPTRDFCGTGCDPFSHRATSEKGSMASATTILNRHYNEDTLKKAIVCHYLYRQEHPHEFHEDMIKQCVFYSSYFLSEKQNYSVLDHFHKRGYDGYCMYNPLDEDYFKMWFKGERGYKTVSEDSRNKLMDLTQMYIKDYIGLRPDGTYGFCPFEAILDDWTNFDPDNWRKYDSFVSTALAIMSLHRPRVQAQKQWKSTDFLPSFNQRGNISRKI
jgi:hypothetical protein